MYSYQPSILMQTVTAINRQADARNVAGAVTAQEDDGVGNFLRVGQAAHGRLFNGWGELG